MPVLCHDFSTVSLRWRSETGPEAVDRNQFGGSGFDRPFMSNPLPIEVAREVLFRLRRCDASHGNVRGENNGFSVVLFAPAAYGASLPDGVVRLTFEEAADALERIKDDPRSAYRAEVLRASLPLGVRGRYLGEGGRRPYAGLSARSAVKTSWRTCQPRAPISVRPLAAAAAVLVGLPSIDPVILREARAALVRSEIVRRSFSGERRVEVEHEGICIAPSLATMKGHALRHQAGDEGHVAGEPVELGHDHRALGCAGSGQRCGGEVEDADPAHRSPCRSPTSTWAPRGQSDALGCGEAGDGGLLRFDPET